MGQHTKFGIVCVLVDTPRSCSWLLAAGERHPAAISHNPAAGSCQSVPLGAEQLCLLPLDRVPALSFAQHLVSAQGLFLAARFLEAAW